MSLEAVLDEDAAKIEEHGFVLIGVEGAGGRYGPGWAYTVGLLDAADHPEMIIAGASVATSGPLLSLLARSVVEESERYAVGETIKLRRGVARVGAVDEVQYALGTFNMWHELRHHGAVETSALQAVQIVLPQALLGSAHDDCQPRLDDPDARIGPGGSRANRAERRRGRHPR